MKNIEFFKQISLWSILGTAALSILLVVPITDNFIDNTKSYLLFFSGAIVILLFILKTLKEKAFRITISPLTSSLLFFGLAATASTFFTSNYPVESLLGMGGTYLATTVIAILGGSLIPKDSIPKFLKTMTVASVLLIVLTVMQMIGFGPAQLINKLAGLSLPSTMMFNLASSPFIALQIVGLTLVGIIASIVKSKKISKFYAVSLPILVIGAGLFAWNLLPGKPTTMVLPPYSASWSIMLDTIRNPKSALIGIGPNAYPNAYSTFKPLWMNNTSQWSAVFSQASNFPLTLLSTMGIIGLATWLFFVVKFAKLHKTSLETSKPLSIMIGAGLLLQLLLPVNTIVLTIQAVALAFLIANEKHRLPLLQLQALKFKVLNKEDFAHKPSKALNLPLYLTVGLGLVGVLSLFYLTGRAYAANVVMSQSTKALAKNDLVGAYELQQKAVTLNPFLDTLRRRYASTNAVVAIALSNKADITDIEKEQVSSLLQQSVREARAATTLDPLDSQNWSNLAQIYQNMIGVSKDAAQWTVQSYIAAIETDPNNPALRIYLANVFASQKDYQQAINILSQAINLKPDLAGTHYNLALVLEEVDQPDAYRQARISYQRALVLLEANSEDYVAVNQKIEALEAMMKEKGISLEAEQSQQPGTTGEEVVNAQENDEGFITPSITEQNLNESNADEEAKTNQDVDLTPSNEDKMIENSDAGASTDASGSAMETNLSEEL